MPGSLASSFEIIHRRATVCGTKTSLPSATYLIQTMDAFESCFCVTRPKYLAPSMCTPKKSVGVPTCLPIKSVRGSAAGCLRAPFLGPVGMLPQWRLHGADP